MAKFGALDGRDNTIAFLGDRWGSQAAKQKRDTIPQSFYAMYGNTVMSTQLLEVSPLEVETVLRLERDA